MTKGKSTKGQTTIYKTKDRETRAPLKILQLEQDEHTLLLEEI
jgi:hypothetical protein